MNTADRAQSYAQAFHEAAMERWLAAMDAVAARLAGDGSLSKRLQAADVEFARRQPLLDDILPGDVDLPVRNLLYALMQRGDLGLLPDIVSSLRQRMRRVEAAPTVVEITSAVALTGEQRQALVTRLEAQYGPGLDVHCRVDPAILGGLIVRIGDKLIDGSVATRLAAMKQVLGVATGERETQGRKT